MAEWCSDLHGVSATRRPGYRSGVTVADVTGVDGLAGRDAPLAQPDETGDITMGRFRFHVASVFLLAIIAVAATAGVSAASTPSNAGASVTPARSARPAAATLRRDGRAPAATAVVRPTTLR